jgi:Flp pilus assembly protein TadD
MKALHMFVLATSLLVSLPATASEKQPSDFPAVVLSEEGQYRRSNEQYTMMLQKDPENPSILNNIGFNYSKIGKVAMARIYYNKALKTGKSKPEVFHNLGMLEFSIGHYQKASEYFTQAMNKGYNRKSCLQNIAIANEKHKSTN